jgi:hypothetical protein
MMAALFPLSMNVERVWDGVSPSLQPRTTFAMRRYFKHADQFRIGLGACRRIAVAFYVVFTIASIINHSLSPCVYPALLYAHIVFE